MKSFIFLISCMLFCMSDSFVALFMGVFLIFTLTLLPNNKTDEYEDNPL
jgi:hypothetical protein